MQQPKAIKLFIFFAAIFFIAKPFIACSYINALPGVTNDTHIVAKAFAKLKPEYWHEDQSQEFLIHKLLSHPPGQLFLSIAFLILLLFPIVSRVKTLTDRFIKRLLLNSLQPQPVYLRAGKLII